jgi:hypothetical protein
MWNYLSCKLGITALRNLAGRLNQHAEIQGMKLEKIERQICAITPGLGRIIAKLDPMYVKDELNPQRKKESDAIGEEVIKKLIAEYIERGKYDK